MNEPQEGCVFELDAGLTLARLLCEGEVNSELFDRLSSCAQRLARADGRSEIARLDLSRACEVLRLEQSVERLPI